MKRTALLLLILTAFSVPLQAGDGIIEKPVRFEPGAQGTTLKGRLEGREGVDYILGARAGQRMSVRLQSDNPQLYFNLLPPGGEEALFVGSSSGDRFAGELPRSGSYRIRVYLMRAAARRGESGRYRLDIEIAGAPRPSSAGAGADFADGDAGGPDFWQVSGLRPGDTLNLRRGPSSGERVVDELDEGDVVRNLGCKLVAGQRWCRVARPDDTRTQGWVAGRYLRESSDQP